MVFGTQSVLETLRSGKEIERLFIQRELGLAGDQGVEVHFVERPAAFCGGSAGQHLEALEQRLGFRAAMGFDDADHDVPPGELRGLRLGQHLEGLADAGGCAEKDLETARRLAPRRLEQGVGRRSPLLSVLGIHVWLRPTACFKTPSRGLFTQANSLSRLPRVKRMPATC